MLKNIDMIQKGMNNQKKWTNEEKEELKKMFYSDLTYEEMGKKLGRTTKAIQIKKFRLKPPKRKYPEKQRKFLSEAKKKEKNPNWKGDKIKWIPALHKWLVRNNPKPEFCELCGIKPPYDLALKEGREYTRNINDYEWLCRSCHMTKDGRMEKLHGHFFSK